MNAGNQREEAQKWRGVSAAVLGAALISALAVPPAAGQTAVRPPAPERALSFHNLHNGEHLTTVYRIGSEYLPEALKAIEHVLRDPLNGEEHPIDPALLDFLFELLGRVGYRGEVQVVCGFRCVETNMILHNCTSGVAFGSLHIQGRALDFRLPGVDTWRLYRIARSMKRGGTGYYKGSDFIHIDTGPVRFW